MTNRFKAWLDAGDPILADGAMGTMLHSSGERLDVCFDELCRLDPDLVLGIHRDYVRAGAQILETNTFGANRFKLTRHGLDEQVAEINATAVALARQAADEADRDVLVAGSVGPLGVRLAPFGRVQPDQAAAVFAEQIGALADAGADLIIVETQSDVYEISEAIKAARQVCDLPVVAMMTFTRDDRTLLGDTATQVAIKLAEAQADVLGANCSGGPAQLLRLIEQMRLAAPGSPLAVMPNAGWPERVADRIMYPATADYFGEYAAALRRAGVILIGGCCGTTPDHIAAMRAALDDPQVDLSVESDVRIQTAGNGPIVEAAEPTEFATKLGRHAFVLSVEMDPPRGFSTHKVLAGAHMLAEAGADVINVADSPMARMRMSPWAVCQLIQHQVDVETVLHFPTRGRNLLRVQGDLLAAHALGVRNVFVVMGDPTAVGDYPEAMDDYDLVPSGLIKLVKHNFNAGVDHSGADIGGPTSFFVGCALNLGAQDVEHEIRLLRKKVEAGADFALTQPVYEPDVARAFVETYTARHGAPEIPILVGMLPLYNARHAAFLHNEVPGIRIPDPIRSRIEASGVDAPKEGIRIAVELLDALGGVVQGAYLMPPFGRYEIAAEIIDAVRAKTPLT
jgi:methionine synthase I (cobalamin-dependent)/5,10-methylenetetrahydrofolate reductase